MFKNLLEDYKRTKRTLRDKKENSIPSRTIIHGWLEFEAQTWIKMACSNAQSTPGVRCQDPDHLAM